MEQRMNKKNGGFTLVELLIAITILGIIVVPFMQSFVTASRTNAKAKKLHNATLLASNLMEEIKANSIEDLAFQFNYPDKKDAAGNSISRFDLIDKTSFDSVAEVMLDGGEYKPVVQYLENDEGSNNKSFVTASVLYEDYKVGTTDDYEYLGQDTGKYYFIMKGADSGTGTYDALITLDANPYKTATDTGFNDQTSPVIDSVDVLKDAFYVQDKNQDKTAAAKIVENGGVSASVDPEILIDGDLSNGELKRTITIDIEKTGTVTKVYTSFTYTPYNFSYSTAPVTEQSLVYSNAESPGYELRRIYLFYLPNYSSASTGSPVMDQIVINNPNNVETDVYLAKQKHSSFNTYIYETKEMTYYCKVTVMEDAGVFNPSTHQAAISIRSNLNENIYDETRDIINKPDLIYSNTESTPQQATTTASKLILNEKDLDAAVEKDRIYDVSISIYETGQADANFTGEPIAVITGSKDN